ncbi:alpha/beta fold hydrolase [Alteromonas lipolytica]|uniref:Alpha/beta hydrolase n=1 Tax=Alteromonas lipolytica TaxID=1856405 RepID=A0A1E8FGB3_9ALTE|nr:alpha/beta fold hydrolase [Alteromonas lipolytica]OFI34985.1 alpha/beta hydrolase [Alteromonas lipolytica]GGF55647.1 alpha/beta hydrolase [Alteromonas lipolytica]
MKFIITLLMFLSFSTLSIAAAESKTSGLHDVGGFKLYIECDLKNDKPTLILEQGFGRAGSDGAWSENVEILKQSYSVCLYDRAGLGKSEPGPVPVTINETAERLNRLLSNARVAPPYYFAGGSYASYIITAYNQRHEDEVLGAVLIDPPPFGYFYTMGTRWPEDFATENEELKRYFQFEQSVHNPMFEKAPEKIDHMASYKQIKDAQSFGDKPLIILRSKPSQERYDPPFVPDSIAHTMDTLFGQAEKNFKHMSSNTTVIYSESDKHHLHISDPELVIYSIKKLAE